METNKNTPVSKNSFFERFATKVSKAAGSTIAFSSAFFIVIVWAASGPF